VSLALTFVLALASGASAAGEVDPDEPLVISAAGVNWVVGNSQFVDAPGMAVQNAELGTQGDAYELAGRLLVNGAAYVAPTAIWEGRSYSGGPVTLSGLEMTLRYVVDDAYPVLGALATFANKSSGEVAATVAWENNISADDGAAVATTGSGDDELTATDRWLVLDNDDDAGGGAPATWFLLYGRGNPRLVPSAASLNTTAFVENEGFRVEYDLQVAPGQAVSLLFLNGLSDTMSRGVVNAANADRFLSAEHLGDAGLSAEDRALIVNFDRGALSVPALSRAGAALLVLAVAVLALFRARGPRVRP
jgi:hypothetical protein